MSTFTASATTLAWRRDATSWNTEGAMQGRYGDQTDRTGVMQFPTVRSVDWPNQAVSKIELKMVFDKVGTSAAKTISLYRGAKNAISGTGAQMRGAAIGSFSTGGTAYSSTRTVAFSESVNAGAFANLVDWLKNGSTNTLVMYRSEAVGAPNWSPNYLRVTSATLTVTYEIAGSGGQLDRDEVFAGETLALSISPLSETAAHEVVWSFGEHVQTQSLDAGETEAAFTVPMDWLDAIPDSASGAAACTLTTFEDGVQKGARTMGFTVLAPQSAAPSFTAAIAADSERVDTEGFYQYLTRAVVRAENASAQYGAAIASYSIYGGENSSGAEDTLTTDYFQLSGAHSYILRVTDTRGLTSEQTVCCEVAAVAQPEVSAFSVERYTTTDEGQFLRSDYGENVWVTVQAAWDELGGLNPAEAYILYGPAGSAERTRVNLPAAGGALSMNRDRTVIPEEIGADTAWVFELVFADRANVTGASDSVAKGRCNVHFAGSGYGAAFGGFAQGTEENPLLESYYPARFYGDVAVDGRLSGGGINELVADQTSVDCGAVASNGWAKVDAFTAPEDGLYLMGADALWQNHSAGQRVVFVRAKSPDGSERMLCMTGYPANLVGHYQSCTTAASLRAGDVVCVEALQSSGSALNTQVKYWAVRLR